MIIQKRGWIIIVLALFLLVATSFSYAETNGCYVYPKATEDLYCAKSLTDTQAKTDCDKYADCSLDQYFLPNKDCSTIKECAPVTCNIDCQSHPLGKCTSLGGTEVTEDQYALKCSPGCCKVADKFCQYNLNEYQCTKEAKKRGLESYTNFFNQLGMNADKCAKEVCALNLEKVPLHILVTDDLDPSSPILQATITIEGQKDTSTTSSDGKATLNLNPGTYSIKASAQGYISTSISITISAPISPPNPAEQKIILKKAIGIADIPILVKENSLGKEIPSQAASLSWTGPTPGTGATDAAGKFTIPSLPAGKYTLIISKIKYQALSKEFTLTANQIIPTQEFLLQPAAFQGITGKIFLDENKNNQFDKKEQPAPGAKIFIDGILRGFSQSDGSYEISITFKSQSDTEKHTLSIIYGGYQSTPQSFNIKKDQTTTKDIALQTSQGICTNGVIKNVEKFSANPVPGKLQVLLQWAKPCPEVIGYEIKRITKTTNAVKEFQVSPLEISYPDIDVQWGETYTYTITATFDKKKSDKPSTQTITLGVSDCENKYDSKTGWSTFCLAGDLSTRKTIWSCTDQNQLYSLQSCGEKDAAGNDFYCAKLSSNIADCKDAGPCSTNANPFGLYYSRSSCYGTNTPQTTKNFCYYDYTNSIVDQCSSCTKISSCFDYKSKDACAINNCLSSSCNWIETGDDSSIIDYSQINLPLQANIETGAGYCVPQTYEKDDQCALCGSSTPPSTLFENTYCTADVCTNLGRCFSDSLLSQCHPCTTNSQNPQSAPSENSNCYTYVTEKECTNKEPITNTNGLIQTSKDRCHWGRCRWTGEKNVGASDCIKDSDANNEDDCASFTTQAELLACKVDNTPPQTSLTTTGKNIISYGYPQITFIGDDSLHGIGSQRSPLGELYFCLTSADANAPSSCSNFINASYNSKKVGAQPLLINLLNLTAINSKPIAGSTYKLQYYSTDKYHNQENIQESFFYVDTLPPNFEIISTPKTIKDITTLSIELSDLQEPATCIVTLTPTYPAGPSIDKPIARDQAQKIVTFENLKGILYNISASCTDDQGNLQTKEKKETFDLDQNIDIIYPGFKSVIAATEIAFKVHTDVGSTCALYNTKTNEKIIEFNLLDSEGKEHQTPLLAGFIEGEYAGDHKVVCQEILDPTKTHQDFFHFTIDFTPPSTQILLQEDKRVEMPNQYGWEEFFVNSAQVAFECQSQGFECDKTYYCLGNGCESITNSKFQEYTGPFELKNTTLICYYSTDKGKNPLYQPLCGSVQIDGYGITLEKPDLYYYNDEVWGVSKISAFPWQFYTKVPTTKCAYDFVSNYNYNDIPPFKLLTYDPITHYIVNNFPNDSASSPYPPEGGVKTLYVRCENTQSDLAPEKKMNLEYDPSPPKIIEALALPNPIIEGTTVQLTVTTDDKTVCKFSDSNQETYSLMSYAFPGAQADVPGADQHQKHILSEKHLTTYAVNTFTGLKKDFSFNIICKNGAGDLSELKNINLTVDYTQLGGVISFSPQGNILPTKDVTLQIQTSKKATCQYTPPIINNLKSNNTKTNSTSPKTNSTTNSPSSNLPSNSTSSTTMNGAGTTQHTSSLTLEEGIYKIPFLCILGEHKVQGSFTFTIDLTAPMVTKVEDGSYTCGSKDISLMVYTNKNNISQYYYEIYDLGQDKGQFSSSSYSTSPSYSSLLNINTTQDYELYYNSKNELNTKSPSSSQTSSQVSSQPSSLIGTLILNATLGPSLPLKIPTEKLNLTHRYITQIKAADLLGRWSAFVSSNGIVINSKNDSVCLNDTLPPGLNFIINQSCTLTSVELHCNDKLVGCKSLLYGQAPTEKICQATKIYTGDKLLFTTNGVICYSVTDYNDNTLSSAKTITLSDSDGDGINNACDQCTQTTNGAKAGSNGCASTDLSTSEKKKDTDGDGLPDSWEQSFDSENCPLNYKNIDSNGDGIKDTDEDYDQDSYSNYQEYTNAQNPCVADGVVKKEEKNSPPEKPTPSSPSSSSETKTNIFAWVVLIIGLLLISGGIGYLIYYYKSSPSKNSFGPGKSSFSSSSVNRPISTSTGPLGKFQSQFSAFEKRESEKIKSRARESIFGTFTKDSKSIPHIDAALQNKTPSVPTIQQLAQKYVQHKDEIQSGLTSSEKNIFAKLENIATRTTEKKNTPNITPQSAQDLFSKLKEISDKRKKKK